MVSERAEAQPSLHSPNGPRIAPQFSDNQPAGSRASRPDTEWSRAQRVSGTETASADGGAQQCGAQQTFAGDARTNSAEAASGSHRPQSDFSADTNAHYRAAEAAAGYNPFTQNHFSTPFGQYPFGPPPFGYPFGMAPPWPPGPPPFFGFPPFGAMPQGAPVPGMMPFGFSPFAGQSGQFADPMQAAYPYANAAGWSNMLRSLWSYLTSWTMWIFSGAPRGVPLPQNGNPSFEAILRMMMAQADIMHQMLLKAAEVVDHARKACQAFAEQSGTAYTPFGSATAFSTPGSPGTARPGGHVDIETLKQSLRTMDPVQAAQVLHAVQVMQAMDGVHRRQHAAGPSGW